MWHAGTARHILFLDRDRWRCRYDHNRYRQLATHDTHGLRMDGNICVLGALGHYLLIKCFEVAEASSVQPFAYLQLVFASGIGMWFFGET